MWQRSRRTFTAVEQLLWVLFSQGPELVRIEHIRAQEEIVTFSAGGVIYPIAFHILFLTLQFGWSVRICAGVSALLCLVACFTVTSALHPRSLIPSLKRQTSDETVTVDVEREGKFAWAMDGLKDRVYVSLIVGNLFVSLGESTFFITSAQVLTDSSSSRYLHPLLLHLFLHRNPPHPPLHPLPIHTLHHERLRGPRPLFPLPPR